MQLEAGRAGATKVDDTRSPGPSVDAAWVGRERDQVDNGCCPGQGVGTTDRCRHRRTKVSVGRSGMGAGEGLARRGRGLVGHRGDRQARRGRTGAGAGRSLRSKGHF